MKTFEINPTVIRQAMMFVSTDHTRLQLMLCVRIGKDGEVWATNGHIAFIGKHTAAIDEDFVVQIFGKIPASVETLLFDFEDNGDGLIRCFNNCKEKTRLAAKLYTATPYPDFHAIVPTGTPLPIEKLCINPKYMAIIAKCFSYSTGEGCDIHQYNDKNSVLVFDDGIDAKALVMPLRQD